MCIFVLLKRILYLKLLKVVHIYSTYNYGQIMIQFKPLPKFEQWNIFILNSWCTMKAIFIPSVLRNIFLSFTYTPHVFLFISYLCMTPKFFVECKKCVFNIPWSLHILPRFLWGNKRFTRSSNFYNDWR